MIGCLIAADISCPLKRFDFESEFGGVITQLEFVPA